MLSGGSGSPRSRTAAPRTGRRPTGPSTLQIDWSVNQREKTVRAAAVQLSATEDKDRNLEAADRLTREAAADGADLVVLPEKFNVLGTQEDFVRGAETLEGRTVSWAREVSRELGIDLVAGSIAERHEGRGKLSNTSVH